MSILNLPSTTDDAILDRLSAAELFKYGRTCKDLHAVVQAYLPRAFQLHKLLAPYFTPAQIVHFRHLQAATGTLISGSTALQFFERTVYPNSDLDLYVTHAHREAIGRWLLEIGYAYVPQPEHVGVATFEEALALEPPSPPPNGVPLGHEFLQQGGNGYIGASCIFTFVKKAPYQKIELISSLRSPLERVLNFHSTCVMNIIAHDKAYAFFPRGTFVERRSLVCARPTVDDLAIKKYAGRGWAVSYGISRAELAAAEGAFAPGPRYVGDAACWTLPVYPALEGVEAAAGGSVEANAWAVRYNKVLRPRMAYYFVDAPRLVHTYLIADDADAHLHRHIEALLDGAEIMEEEGEGNDEESDDEEEQGPPLDREFAALIRWYREDHSASTTCPLSSAMQWAEADDRHLTLSDSDLEALQTLLRDALGFH